MDFFKHSFDNKKMINTKINTVSSKNNVGKSFIDLYREMKEIPTNKTHQSKVSTSLPKNSTL
ncbi:hypothetical protein DB729_005540 [Streptococcus halitosis]|uniref:Uncharacterized protein n=1 Tax=Streptococcus halitosis TaxID=2172545 RepID=A0A3R8LWI6_9STRE|nr:MULTISPECIES: hypothetical protein [Streptococcus]NIB84226.1 hypothetical protein [Streptococcus sp. CCUG 71758]RRN47736.1 hypothetical protein DB729_005540 [Streptococcus halitosis]